MSIGWSETVVVDSWILTTAGFSGVYNFNLQYPHISFLFGIIRIASPPTPEPLPVLPFCSIISSLSCAIATCPYGFDFVGGEKRISHSCCISPFVMSHLIQRFVSKVLAVFINPFHADPPKDPSLTHNTSSEYFFTQLTHWLPSVGLSAYLPPSHFFIHSECFI